MVSVAAADTYILSSSNMSGLVRWLATSNPQLKVEWSAPKTDGLPNPNEREESNAAVCAAANAEIELSMADGQITRSTSNSRKQGPGLAISTTTLSDEPRWHNMHIFRKLYKIY